MSQTRRFPLALVAVPLVVILCGLLPRWIVQIGGVDSAWTAFLYQYALGGLVFGIGLFIIRRSGACRSDRPGDSTWFRVLIFGYLWYAAIHAAVTYLSLAVPFKGT